MWVLMNALCKLSLKTKASLAENEIPKKWLPSFKLFNQARQTHEIFRVGKCVKKIKFDEICRYQNGVFFKVALGRSSMYRRKKSGPNVEP